jgi:hypothetical protein
VHVARHTTRRTTTPYVGRHDRQVGRFFWSSSLLCISCLLLTSLLWKLLFSSLLFCSLLSSLDLFSSLELFSGSLIFSSLHLFYSLDSSLLWRSSLLCVSSFRWTVLFSGSLLLYFCFILRQSRSPRRRIRCTAHDASHANRHVAHRTAQPHMGWATTRRAVHDASCTVYRPTPPRLPSVEADWGQQWTRPARHVVHGTASLTTHAL